MTSRNLGFASLAAGILWLLVPCAQAQISDDTVKIGVLADMSGLYSDLSGIGSVVAARMAAEDFGGAVLGKKIEIVSADHQNKPDIGSNIARKWIERQGVDAIADVPVSSIAFAVQQIAKDKNRVLLISSSGSSDFTGKSCSPTSVHWTYDTYALAQTAGKAMIEQGGDSWFFITADYAFGHALERDTAAIVRANGGKVLGAVRHPQDTPDLSSYLLQAQNSTANVIGLANAGGDTINSIKQANEFGIVRGGQKMIGLLTYISDVHGIGLQYAKGLILASAFYWDLTEQTRAWTKRFMERSKKIPTMANAGVYGATLHYLKAIKETGTDEAQAVVHKMKEIPVNDFFTKDGRVREDGRVIRDMYLFQVKSPEDSKYPYDYYRLLKTVPGLQAFRPLADGGCPMIAKKS